MNKIRRVFIALICLCIITLPVILVACNNDNTEDFYSESKFYGEYNTPEKKYFDVTFIKKDSNESSYWKIVGVKAISFVYVHLEDKNNPQNIECKEQNFDTALLTELDSLLSFMGNQIQLYKDNIFFKNSRQHIYFNPKDMEIDNDWQYIKIFKDNYEIASCEYGFDNPYSILHSTSYKKISINLIKKDIRATDGSEWSIYVGREYRS